MKNSIVQYRRVSTQSQGKSGLGLDAQQTILENYYRTIENGVEVLADFVEVQSGKKLIREELEKAVAYCKKHKATLVIAKLDRLARSVFFISRLIQSGVKFIVAESPNDDTFTLHIKASVAEEEARRISERTRQALSEWKRRNPDKSLGTPNYAMGEDNKRRADEFAESVRGEITNILANGIKRADHLVFELNRNGVKSARGGEWKLPAVYSVLKRLGIKLNARKSQFDVHRETIIRKLTQGCSVRAIAAELGFNSHVGLNKYVNSRNLKATA
jgi:DNA invertase Pin-like site-specific DNA recombinase